jgi:hypothetical protein
MNSSWQIQEGRLTRRWSGQLEHIELTPALLHMQTNSGVQSGYLTPLPDFASHSPFGGPSWFWFLPENYYRNRQ